jgi:Arc/MetJ-type ribon-helix-helix transcriptional regulator
MTETTIRLPVELERFLSAQVKQGLHRSREAAILAVLERERRRTQQLVWLKREVQKGVDALDEGRVVTFDPDNIKRRGRARLAARKRSTRG